MFVMAAVNRQRASSVDENLCVIERLNNGKPIFLVKNRIKLRHTCATRALLILQPRKNQTLFQRRSRTQPSRSYFGCDQELKFMFLTAKLTLILTLNNSYLGCNRLSRRF